MDLYKTTLTVYGHELRAAKAASSEASESDNEVNLYGVPSSNADSFPQKELKAMTVTERPVATAAVAAPPPLADESNLSDTAAAAEISPWPDFGNRIDSVVVLLARQMPNLSVLVSRNSIQRTRRGP